MFTSKKKNLLYKVGEFHMLYCIPCIFVNILVYNKL